MGAYAGPANAWSNFTNQNRLDASTKLVNQSGLMLNLDAGVSSSYPGSGTTWTDLSGNGNTGTLVNGVGYSGDNLGSLSFDGSNDYITTSFTYQNNNDYTMSCWIKTSVTQLCGLIGFRREYRDTDWWQTQIYITGDNNAGTSGNFLKLDDFNRNAGGSPEFPARRSIFLNTESITTGTWKNIVVSSDSVGARLYINAELKAQENSTPSPTRSDAATFTIGAAGNYPLGPIGQYKYNGQMSGVSFYNRALTAAEITQNFNAIRARFGL